MILLALLSCDRDALYTQSTFSENVYDAYAECRASEIRFLAGKHNLQTAFEPCGSNNLVHFQWAPDGIQLFFQMPLQAAIMNGEDKTIGNMPTEVPMAASAWLARDLLVLPLVPAAGETEHRLLMFDRIGATTTTLKIPHAPGQLQAAGNRHEVYYIGTEDDGTKALYVADFHTLSHKPVFPWATEVDTFTYEPTQQLVTLGVGETVRVHQTSGDVVYTFDDAHRGIVHPEGRFIALEAWGDPISPFDQRSWDEVSPETREREERRMEEWLDNQPEWVPKETVPPVIDIYDAEVKHRVRFSAFYGDRFQWYTASNYFASFVLWGLEGKEVNPNVALTQLYNRLAMAADGGVLPQGMEILPVVEAAPSTEEPPSDDARTVSPETPPTTGG